MRALGVSERIIAGYSVEFLSGMAGEVSRSRRLGDIGENNPENWTWGGLDNVPHLLIMLFAKRDLENWKQKVQMDPWDKAFETQACLPTSNMGNKEPFGFRDGISQPEIDWKRARGMSGNTVEYGNVIALGELLLGYPNEYGKYTDRPLIDAADDAEGVLRPAEDVPGKKDLGRNGAYIVLRQLEQDVRRFWQYLDRMARGNPEERYRLGAAMVGRTVDGEPLIPASGERVPGLTDRSGQPRNAFTYDGDPAGMQCPLGAHIRRANPRNADLSGHPSGALSRLSAQLGIPRPPFHRDMIASTRFHRILRRGREYGPKLTPEEALQPGPPDDPARGLLFACLNANIARQFEFVQNAWLMSTKFNGLTEESDPLLGNRAAVGDCPFTGGFSIQRAGRLPRRLTGMPQFTAVRGGAYFFLPSLRVLRYFARGQHPGETTSTRQE
jgi:deferrochelatase/peroxidase EfeB